MLRSLPARTRIPLLLFAAGAAFIGVDHQLDVGARQRSAIQVSLAHSNGTVQQLAERFASPAAADGPARRAELVELGRLGGAQFAAVIDAGGRIVEASADSLRGRWLRDLVGADAEAHGSVERRDGAAHSRLLERERMLGVAAIGGGRGERVVFVQDLHERLARAAAGALADMLPETAIGLLLIALVALLLEHWLSRPARRIAQTAERIAAGDRAARTGLRGAAEMMHAGEAFDRMAAQVEESERELRTWERRFDYVAELTGQSFFEWNLVTRRSMRPTEKDPVFGVPTPTDIDEILAMWESHLHPDDRARATAELADCMRSGRPFDCEYRFRHGDGRERVVRDRAFFELGEGGRPGIMVGTMTDITAQKELEEQLRQAQKMETVGTLAGGIAHDFNNQLTGIVGHLELLGADLALDDPRREHVRIARQAAERCAELTRGLLAFSRRLASHPRAIALAPLVSESLELLRRVLPASVVVETELESSLPCVMMDPVQLQQVLFNLCVNARDAMPHGGRLRVSARPMVLAAGERRAGDARAGAFVEMAVADDGEGIAADVLPRIFEPFFTTKPVGVGTGLGLAMVYGIVSKHQGWVEVESAPGHGACFRVFLPIASEAPAAQTAPRAAAPAPAAGVSVLVVDDEGIVRDLAAHILRAAGYRVLTAAGGIEALTIARAADAAIDVVLLDRVMPGQSGEEVGAALAALRPDLRIVLTSGFAPEAHLGGGARTPFLQKPYSRAELLDAIRDALAPAAPARG